MLNEVSSATTVALAASCRGRREEGLRKREREQHQRGDAQRQQDDLPQPARGGVLDRRVAQERHGGKPHPRFRLALEQVQDDRHGRRERADAGTAATGRTSAALARVERYASSAISSGCFVFSS